MSYQKRFIVTHCIETVLCLCRDTFKFREYGLYDWGDFRYISMLYGNIFPAGERGTLLPIVKADFYVGFITDY
ncbi:hypothetical protein EMIT0357P_220008 [Pseudomonas marginalis]